MQTFCTDALDRVHNAIMCLGYFKDPLLKSPSDSHWSCLKVTWWQSPLASEAVSQLALEELSPSSGSVAYVIM